MEPVGSINLFFLEIVMARHRPGFWEQFVLLFSFSGNVLMRTETLCSTNCHKEEVFLEYCY